MKFFAVAVLVASAMAAPALEARDVCPGGLTNSNPKCCSVDVLGVLSLDCTTRKSYEYQKTRSSRGKRSTNSPLPYLQPRSPPAMARTSPRSALRMVARLLPAALSPSPARASSAPRLSVLNCIIFVCLPPDKKLPRPSSATLF